MVWHVRRDRCDDRFEQMRQTQQRDIDVERVERLRTHPAPIPPIPLTVLEQRHDIRRAHHDSVAAPFGEQRQVADKLHRITHARAR